MNRFCCDSLCNQGRNCPLANAWPPHPYENVRIHEGNPIWLARWPIGAWLVGGKLYTYSAGTTTPKNTYTSSTLGTPNANPTVLDSRGEADIWLDGAYKFVLKDSSDVTIWTVDNIISDNCPLDFTDTIPDGSWLKEWLEKNSYWANLAAVVGLLMLIGIGVWHAY